ncbi:MAG: sulfite exporter TauE/SafE family protein [Planctomycetes bacterium]|nr:sulfite exporter TauE/SafE family protein [Planctomycetota bacterium]
MVWLLLPITSFVVAAITLLSGFGLGTVLMPAFALFFPVEVAIAATGVVHFVSNLFKLPLVGRHADRGAVLRFGLPAIVAAAAGAWMLSRLAPAEPLASWALGSLVARVTWVKLLTGFLLLAFAGLELLPWYRALVLPRRWLAIGGALSGFFGGLSGMQGALRAPFLMSAGLSKQAYVGTANVISTVVDASRLVVYGLGIAAALQAAPTASGDRPSLFGLVAAACVAGCVGSWVGSRWLQSISVVRLRLVVAVLLAVAGVALVTGVTGA